MPIGLASLIFASVPLWLVVLRSTHRRPAAAGLPRRDGGRVHRRRPPPAARRRRQRVRRAARRRRGALLGDRHVPLLEAADAGRRAHDGRRPGPHRRAAADPARAWRSSDGESLQPGRLVDPLAPRAALPGRVRLDLRLHGVRLARRQRAARHRRDLRVREPARRDHARRPLPRRGDHVADRRRRGGDPDLGRRRDPPRGAAAAGGRDSAGRGFSRSSGLPGRAEPLATGRSRPGARARGAAASRSRRASPRRRPRSRRRSAARRRP